MSFNVNEAVDYARRKAFPDSREGCTKRVREAIECGGIPIGKTQHAKDYGPLLERAGFKRVSLPAQKGDIVVIQPPQGDETGHMAIFDGMSWVSSSVHLHLYPEASYRAANSPYKVYRYP